MLRHRHIDRICGAVCALAVLFTALLLGGEAMGLVAPAAATSAPYQSKLLEDGSVHAIDIVMGEADWEAMLENALAEEYVRCNLVIDGEAYKNVAIRPKGNTSLSQVASMDSDRYSFKVEFDHYDKNKTYYGLDKLCLNNLIQDTTYLKDYLSYHMMGELGVAAPLSSFAYLTVNGEDFGLYLAVEGVEEAFLERNYGAASGNLYKPDGMGGMGGGGGPQGARPPGLQDGEQTAQTMGEGEQTQDSAAAKARGDRAGFPGGDRGGAAALQYVDGDLDSYQVIWNGAVTDPADQDKERLVESIRKLNAGEDLESAVDVEATLRYFAVHNFVLNFDSYTGNMLHNYYLYERDGRMSILPWDYNLAFGAFQGMGGRGGESDSKGAAALVNYPIDTPVSGATLEARPLLGKLLEVPQYLERYHQYLDQLVAQYFESGVFEAELDRVVALITPYVERDPTAFYTLQEFEAGTQTLRQFCLLRAESIRGQLEGTIPSTAEGQTADSSSLIDASGVTVSAMGGMGEGRGGGQRQAAEAAGTEGDGAQAASGQRAAQPDTGGGETAAPAPADGENGRTAPPGGWGGMGGPQGDGASQQEESAPGLASLLLLAASVVGLGLGILFVRKYRA